MLRFLCALAFGAAITLGQGDPASHRIVRVSDPSVSRPNEVAVAINPRDPNNVVVVAGARGGKGGPSSINVSFTTVNGGLTWRTTQAPNAGRTQGDDAVVFDAEGTAWRSYIAFTGLRVPRPTSATSGIFVSASRDGGMSWQAPITVVDHLNTVTPFEDKPWLAVDREAGSPHRGTLYVAWTRFDVYGSKDPSDHSHIFVARSAPDRTRFLPPVRVSDTPGDALDSDGTVEGAVPAVGVGGEVFLAWAGPKGLQFDRSTDGGVTFAQDVHIADMPGGWDIDVAGLTRHNGMPVTAVDLSRGPRRGAIYVNWIDIRHGDPDVFLSVSRDGGRTWSAPRVVNEGSPGDGRQQLFAWMAVDPADGSINVIYYEREQDSRQSPLSLKLARSMDGGQRFTQTEIAQPSFTCPDRAYIGDYSGIDARDGLIVPAWTSCVGEDRLAVSAAWLRFK
jgi:hypothetical protein